MDRMNRMSDVNGKSTRRRGGAEDGNSHDALALKCQRLRSWIVSLLCVAALLMCVGCQAFDLVGGAMQNAEYQKLVDTPPKYAGLEDKTVAVLVSADMSTLYEFPTLTAEIAGGVAARIS